MSHLSAVNLATGWLGMSTHAAAATVQPYLCSGGNVLLSSQCRPTQPSAALGVVQPAE